MRLLRCHIPAYRPILAFKAPYHNFVKSKSLDEKGIPLPRDYRHRSGQPIRSVAEFFHYIGRNMTKEVGELIDSWERLFTITSKELKEGGVPIKPRRYLMRQRHNYMLGVKIQAFPMPGTADRLKKLPSYSRKLANKRIKRKIRLRRYFETCKLNKYRRKLKTAKNEVHSCNQCLKNLTDDNVSAEAKRKKATFELDFWTKEHDKYAKRVIRQEKYLASEKFVSQIRNRSKKSTMRLIDQMLH